MSTLGKNDFVTMGPFIKYVRNKGVSLSVMICDQGGEGGPMYVCMYVTQCCGCAAGRNVQPIAIKFGSDLVLM